MMTFLLADTFPYPVAATVESPDRFTIQGCV